MNSIEKKRRKYIQQMLKKTKDNMDEEKSFMYQQTHDRHMKEIREKNKVSPDGGKPSFKKTDGR
tara:strand:+ start:125 stop:316 length:192 start_codon:yes stop_codon:yes gene_type:complete